MATGRQRIRWRWNKTRAASVARRFIRFVGDRFPDDGRFDVTLLLPIGSARFFVVERREQYHAAFQGDDSQEVVLGEAHLSSSDARRTACRGIYAMLYPYLTSLFEMGEEGDVVPVRISYVAQEGGGDCLWNS